MDSISLSPWGLFFQAGPVVKGVMIILLAASVWCWVLIIELLIVARRVHRALRDARASRSGGTSGLLAPVFSAPAEIAPLAGATSTERRQHVADAMRRAARRLLAQAERGLPSLAVISSVAPFIGLFGTVWGIMTSFAGIAEARETSLAIVAPGIAEALAATAYGLAAAIPAAIGYNRIGALFSHYGQDISDLVDERAAALMSCNHVHAETL